MAEEEQGNTREIEWGKSLLLDRPKDRPYISRSERLRLYKLLVKLSGGKPILSEEPAIEPSLRVTFKELSEESLLSIDQKILHSFFASSSGIKSVTFERVNPVQCEVHSSVEG